MNKTCSFFCFSEVCFIRTVGVEAFESFLFKEFFKRLITGIIIFSFISILEWSLYDRFGSAEVIVLIICGMVAVILVVIVFAVVFVVVVVAVISLLIIVNFFITLTLFLLHRSPWQQAIAQVLQKNKIKIESLKK